MEACRFCACRSICCGADHIAAFVERLAACNGNGLYEKAEPCGNEIAPGEKAAEDKGSIMACAYFGIGDCELRGRGELVGACE
jgi:hypothetical protein